MSDSKVSLFISHTENDRDLVDLIVQGIKTHYDLPDSRIRCTSLPGYKLPGGTDIITTIRREILSATAVIGVITPHSLQSPWVLCELGAVWGQTGSLIPTLAGIEYENLKGPLIGAHCWRLDDKDHVVAILQEVGEKTKKVSERREPNRQNQEKSINSIVNKAKKYEKQIPVIPVNYLYGLHFSSENLSEDRKVFQNFKVSRKTGSNVNAVHFLWSDTFTNSFINALVFSEKKQNFLRVWFNNGERTLDQGEFVKAWPSNIKIKPLGDNAFKNFDKNSDLKYRFMKFSARVPQDALEKADLIRAAVSIRLLDRRLTYWEYAKISKGGQPSQFLVTKNWNEFTIDLVEGGYGVFNADGNNTELMMGIGGLPKPDFSVVAGITFVVGSHTAGVEEPGSGRGIIDFKNIVFSNK